jgi:hypothetical protein
MTNSVRKGYRSQRKTHLYLEKRGWEVYTVPRVRFAKNHDVFHLFDHLAHRRGKFRFVQTKSNNCSKWDKERIARFKTPSCIIKEVFIWKDYAREPTILKL